MKLTQWNTAHSICSPSRAALLTGRYAIRSGIYGNETHIEPGTGDHRVVHPNCYGGLPATELTIAEALKEANYTSMAIGKWHLVRTATPHRYGGTSLSIESCMNNVLKPLWSISYSPQRKKKTEPVGAEHDLI